MKVRNLLRMCENCSFPAVAENMYSSMTANNQPLTGIVQGVEVVYISDYRVWAAAAKGEEKKKKKSKWTEYYYYDDHHQAVQMYCYQFVIFLTM
jgi:hypothetical protein